MSGKLKKIELKEIREAYVGVECDSCGAYVEMGQPSQYSPECPDSWYEMGMDADYPECDTDARHACSVKCLLAILDEYAPGGSPYISSISIRDWEPLISALRESHDRDI